MMQRKERHNGRKTVEAEKARDDIKSKLRELNTKAQKQIFDLNHNFKDLTAEIQKLNKEKVFK